MTNDQSDIGGLTITIDSEEGVAVLVAAGELDADTSGQLRDAFEGLSLDPRAVVIDLSAVTFIDSSGLTSLLHGFKQADERGSAFSLRAPSPAVRRLLELTGQTERFLPSSER